jgi:O-antigen/teichoic acid export membrane protein
VKPPLRNMISLAWSDLGSRAIGFFITVYLARVLGPAAYGLVGVGFAVLGHAQLLSSPGMQVVEARNAARPGGMGADRFGAVIGLRMFLSSVVCVAGVILLALIPAGAPMTTVILWSMLVVFPLAITPDWFLQGRERMVPLGLAKVGGYLVYGAMVWLLINVPGDAAMAPVAYGTGALATAILLWIAVGREFALPHFGNGVRLWRSVLRENAPVGLAMFVGQQVMNLPPIVLAAMRTNEEAGMYNAALKLVFLLLLLDRVLNALLLPALTRVRETRPHDSDHLAALTARTVLAIAGVVVVPGMFIAPMAMQLVFGSAYAAAGAVARILLVYVGLTLVNSVAVCVLLAAGKEQLYSRTMIAGSLALAIAMIALTPLWGTIGTALGAVIGELATVLLMIRGAARASKAFTRDAVLRPVIASACAAVPGLLLVSWSAPVAAAAAVVTFGVAASAMNVFGAGDVAFLKERFL